jgi:hypothetical protein
MPNSRKSALKDDISNLLKDIQDHPIYYSVPFEEEEEEQQDRIPGLLSEPEFSGGPSIDELKRLRKNLKNKLKSLDEINREIQNREEENDTGVASTSTSTSRSPRRRPRRRTTRRSPRRNPRRNSRISVGGKRKTKK